MWSLHNHTCYSNASLGFPDCINKVEDLIKRAKEIGLEGIAITDHEILSAHLTAENLSEQYEFPVILGNEIYLMEDNYYDKVRYQNISDKRYPHFILLAMDEIGHKQLRLLSSIAWRDNAFTAGGLMRRPTKYSDIEKVIGQDPGHIIAATACIGGELGIRVLRLIEAEEKNDVASQANERQPIEHFLNWCVNTFGKDNFFIEIQPPNMDSSTMAQHKFNHRIVKLAEYFKIPMIVTSDSHYLKKEDAVIHDAYLNSKKDEEREVSEFYATAYLMAEKEMKEYFKVSEQVADLPKCTMQIVEQAMANTSLIGSRLKTYSLKHTQIVPIIKPPSFEVQHLYKEYYDNFPMVKQYAYSNEEQDRYLIYRFEKAIQEKEQNRDIQLVLDRVNKELIELEGVSQKLGQRMSAYYLTMSKIIEIVWDKADSLVGVSRGSGGSFITDYFLDITQFDPLDYGDLTPHWRHLTADRPELPDIDFDTESSARGRVLQSMRDFFGENRVLNVCTFGTLSSKTALQVAGRGLGLNDDDVNAICDTIPIERGQVYSIKECLEGNEEMGKSASREFKNAVERIPRLLEVAQQLEGLINQRGIHASGVIITNDNYETINACMRAPKGQLTTQWDLHDTEAMGGLKYDFLTVKTIDKIRKTLNMLLKYGYMEWQGTLKKTYDKYLNPKVLDYDNKDMWDNITNIPSLFQFDTAVGSQAVKLTSPKSVIDLSTANSLMRLMGDGGETPLNQYVRYKNDINQWYEDMTKYGLNQNEQDILKEYLGSSYGLAESQEKLMLLSMDQRIAGFSLKQANGLRKAIAKKKPKLLLETEQLFYNQGKALNSREIFLKYIWEEVFAKSKGYGFSSIHSIGYSLVALQQMNLYCKYPSIVWNTACLIIDSCGDEDNEENKSQDYGKTAIAIDNLTKNGVKVLLPDINKSEFEFIPDIESNSVFYGIKGITGLNDDYTSLLLEERNKQSFISIEEFMERIPSVKKQMVNLVKSGMFDSLYPNCTREEIMMKYLDAEVSKTFKPRKSLSASDIEKIIELGLFDKKGYEKYLHHYTFFKEVTSKKYFYTKEKNKSIHLIKYNDLPFQFFDINYKHLLKEGEDYSDIDEGVAFKKSALEKKYNEIMADVMTIIGDNSFVEKYNQQCYNNSIQALWKKYCKGTVSTWEMDALCYYSHPHELAEVNRDRYGIKDFTKLSEIPEVIGTFPNQLPRYKLCRIAGAVLDKNKTRHTVSLLTLEGVVTVKFPDYLFNQYNQQISFKRADGKKQLVEKSWFSRGVLLLVTGYRRDDNFAAKRYKDSVYSAVLAKINGIKEDGTLILQDERLEAKPENVIEDED